MNPTPSTPAPEVIDYEQELIKILQQSEISVEKMNGISSFAYFPKTAINALKDFASRIISAERQAGWKKMEWIRPDKDTEIYKLFCGDEIVSTIIGYSFGYSGKTLLGNSYTNMDLETVKYEIEANILHELNSLRSTKEEGWTI